MEKEIIFARQVGIEEIGEEGQKKLDDALVLVVGAGGLGSPVITYLASAGVGKIIVADGDTIELSNLNRQFLHSIHDIGKNKAESAEATAGSINGVSTIISISKYLTREELDQLLVNVDCVINCVDSYEVRKEVGRACLRARVPLVEAGVRDLYGWILCIDNDHACLECAGIRDLTEEQSPAILGAVAGVVGSTQALECIKILIGSDDVSFGRLINFDGRHMEMESVPLVLDPNCEAHRLVQETV